MAVQVYDEFSRNLVIFEEREAAVEQVGVLYHSKHYLKRVKHQ